MKYNLFIITISLILSVTSKDLEASNKEWPFPIVYVGSSSDPVIGSDEKIPEDIREFIELEQGTHIANKLSRQLYGGVPGARKVQKLNLIRLRKGSQDREKFINLPSLFKDKEGYDLYPFFGEGYEGRDGRFLHSLVPDDRIDIEGSWDVPDSAIDEFFKEKEEEVKKIKKEIEKKEEEVKKIEKEKESMIGEKSNKNDISFIKEKDNQGLAETIRKIDKITKEIENLTESLTPLEEDKKMLISYQETRDKNSVLVYRDTGWFAIRMSYDIHVIWNSKGPERYYLRRQISNSKNLNYSGENRIIQNFVQKSIDENKKRTSNSFSKIYQWANESSGLETEISQSEDRSSIKGKSESYFGDGFVIQSLDLERGSNLSGKKVLPLKSLIGFSSDDFKDKKTIGDDIEKVMNDLIHTPPFVKRFASQLKISPMEWIRKEYLPKIAQLLAEQHYRDGFIKWNNVENTVAIVDKGKITSFIIRGSYGVVDLEEKTSLENIFSKGGRNLLDMVLVNEVLPNVFKWLFVKEYLENYVKEVENITKLDLSHLVEFSSDVASPHVTEEEIKEAYKAIDIYMRNQLRDDSVTKIDHSYSSDYLLKGVDEKPRPVDLLNKSIKKIISHVQNEHPEIFRDIKQRRNADNCRKSFN